MQTVDEIYDEVNKDFNLKQVKGEFVQFMQLVKDRGYKNFMEIGSNEGGTFLSIGKILPIDSVKISLDIINGGFGGLNEMEYNKRNKKLKSLLSNCHFINKNSHSFEAKTIVEYILGENKLDVLFIDGDHTYNGVKKDYETFNGFVRGGGIIAFHDIKNCPIHHEQGCYVDEFWNEVNGDKKEFLVPQKDEWGGIGIINKPYPQYKIFQIYYDNNQVDSLNPALEPYFNTINTKYFENDVILKIYEKLDTIKEKYVGTTSWKFKYKTKFDNLMDFEDKLEYKIGIGNQVIFFTPKEFQSLKYAERNKKIYPVLFQLCRLIDKANGLPFLLEGSNWTSSYCNYWIAEKSVFKDYVERILIPCISLFENNKEIMEYCNKNVLYHHNKAYPLYPFVLESLMGFYVNKFRVQHASISPD